MNKIQLTINYGVSTVLIILTIIFLTGMLKYKSTINDLTELQTLTTNELTIYKDENSKLIYTNSVLELDNFKHLENIKSNDSTVQRLRQLIKKEKNINSQLQGLILLQSQTQLAYKDSIENLIVSYDSIIKDGVVHHYPTYSRKVDMFNNWITGNIELGKSKFDINLQVKSDYDIILIKERKNIFKPYEYKIKVSNLNPYVTTGGITTVQKKVKKDRYNISISGGYGMGKDGFTGFVGITGGYSIITF